MNEGKTVVHNVIKANTIARFDLCDSTNRTRPDKKGRFSSFKQIAFLKASQ